MSILSFSITQVRNILSTTLNCSPTFNLFFGDNAAGKTSILESIYYLSTGKSFRTHLHEHVIHKNHEDLVLFSQLQHDELILNIGIQRYRSGQIKIHVNNQAVSSISNVSHYLPVQFIGSDSHRILSDGPKARRQFLDWGLFYTNPLFFNHWKTFQKLLVQRNAALKARAPRDELLIWNHAFAEAAELLNTMRETYVNELSPVFAQIASFLLPNLGIKARYLRGWDAFSPLESCLNHNVSRETLVGHALYGPQRADLEIMVGDSLAHDVLSQGQQKLVSYALKLAQGIHLHQATNKAPIYLIDDLPSELDHHKRILITEILSQVNAQVFITGINPVDLEELLASNKQNKMFHVKHGAIEEFK